MCINNLPPGITQAMIDGEPSHGTCPYCKEEVTSEEHETFRGDTFHAGCWSDMICDAIMELKSHHAKRNA